MDKVTLYFCPIALTAVVSSAFVVVLVTMFCFPLFSCIVHEIELHTFSDSFNFLLVSTDISFPLFSSVFEIVGGSVNFSTIASLFLGVF